MVKTTITATALVAQMKKPFRAGRELRYLIHAGAEHGYALPDRDVDSSPPTAIGNAFAMFRRQLRTGPDDLPF